MNKLNRIDNLCIVKKFKIGPLQLNLIRMLKMIIIYEKVAKFAKTELKGSTYEVYVLIAVMLYIKVFNLKHQRV